MNITNWTLHWTSTANRSQNCSIHLLVLIMTREIKWGNLQFYKNWPINVHYIHIWFQHLGLYSYLDVFVQFIALETSFVWLTWQQKWEKFLQHSTQRMKTYDDEVWDMETNYDTPSLRTSKNELLIFIPVAKTWK